MRRRIAFMVSDGLDIVTATLLRLAERLDVLSDRLFWYGVGVED